MTVRRPAPAFRGVAVTMALVGSLAASIVFLAAPTVGADSGRPTNFESTIDSISPTPDGVTIEIVGNDAFVRVSADRGTEVEIPGYDGEPYLRIRADGTVQENQLSAARFLNDTMSGDAELSGRADSDADPQWADIGSDGTVAWHDHRTHWMFEDDPPVDEDGRVQQWEVPMTVDGTEVTVTGHLSYIGNTAPWGIAVTVAVALVAWSVMRRDVSARRLVGPTLTGVASGAAAGLWLAEWAAAPSDARPGVIPLVLAGSGLAASALAVARPTIRPTALLTAVALLTGWTVVRISVWWKPLLPTSLPAWVDRGGTAFVAGVAAGVAVAELTDPGRRSTSARPEPASPSSPAP